MSRFPAEIKALLWEIDNDAHVAQGLSLKDAAHNAIIAAYDIGKNSRVTGPKLDSDDSKENLK